MPHRFEQAPKPKPLRPPTKPPGPLAGRPRVPAGRRVLRLASRRPLWSLRLHKEYEMSDIVSQVSSSISGLRQEFDVIAHNMANVTTVGFKRRCNTFSKSLMAQDAGTQAGAGGGGGVGAGLVFA